VKLAIDDSEAFVYLVQRYEKRFMAYIRRLMSVSNEEAEDVLQEIFIKIYQNLQGFDLDLKFSSWAYRVAYNYIISCFRKFKARPQCVSSEDVEKLLLGLSADDDVNEDLHKKFEGEKVQELLGQLDKKYKDVLVLKYLEDKDYKEISYILKKPMGSIATLLSRAKSKFKKLLVKNKILND